MRTFDRGTTCLDTELRSSLPGQNNAPRKKLGAVSYSGTNSSRPIIRTKRTACRALFGSRNFELHVQIFFLSLHNKTYQILRIFALLVQW